MTLVGSVEEGEPRFFILSSCSFRYIYLAIGEIEIGHNILGPDVGKI